MNSFKLTALYTTLPSKCLITNPDFFFHWASFGHGSIITVESDHDARRFSTKFIDVWHCNLHVSSRILKIPLDLSSNTSTIYYNYF